MPNKGRRTPIRRCTAEAGERDDERNGPLASTIGYIGQHEEDVRPAVGGTGGTEMAYKLTAAPQEVASTSQKLTKITALHSFVVSSA